MQINEFQQRTGYFPCQIEYEAIEQEYMEFDGDKDAFCKAYKENTDGMAEKIQRRVNENYSAEIGEHVHEIRSRDAVIETLKEHLELEQEWKPFEFNENVQQTDYIKLRTAGDTRELTDEETKNLLYDLYGFAKEKITIQKTVPVYEVNRHRQLRKVGDFERKPLYYASDWNYIRFNCGCMCYEMFNNDLRPYMQ